MWKIDLRRTPMCLTRGIHLLSVTILAESMWLAGQAGVPIFYGLRGRGAKGGMAERRFSMKFRAEGTRAEAATGAMAKRSAAMSLSALHVAPLLIQNPRFSLYRGCGGQNM